jgi:hypothetical protein
VLLGRKPRARDLGNEMQAQAWRGGLGGGSRVCRRETGEAEEWKPGSAEPPMKRTTEGRG